MLLLSRYFRNPSNIATVTGDMTDNLSAKFTAFSLPYFLRIVHTRCRNWTATMSASKEVVVYKQNEGVTISQWKSLLNRAGALGMVKVNALFTVLFWDEVEQD